MNEIRFNLDDIIEGNLVDDVIVSLDMTSQKKMFKRIVFWKNWKVSTKQLDDFMKKVDKKLTKEIRVEITTKKPQSEYVWFDVINEENTDRSLSRFSFIYPSDKKTNILLGIQRFYFVMDFVEKSRGKRIIYKKEQNGHSRSDKTKSK